MNEIELTNKAIEWLQARSRTIKRRPHPFTPKEVTDEVGGYPGTLGKVADTVIAELLQRGIAIRYVRTGKSRYFELLSQ